jgi:hypothetical protein
MTDPFAQFRTDNKPSAETFAKLNELVQNLVKAEADVLAAEEKLKEAQERKRQIEEFDLPNFLEELGLASFKTTDGVEIEVEKKLRASIGNRKAEAYKWLLENGHGAIIKRTIQVAFNTDQGKEAQDLLDELANREGYAGVRQELKVEPATLTAWAKEQLEQGVDIPEETFGIFEQKFARIKKAEQ